MVESKLVALVRRADGTMFKIVPPGLMLMDEAELAKFLAKDGLQLFAIGSVDQIDRVEADIRITGHVHET